MTSPLQRLTLHHLRVFRAVAKHDTIAQAAAQLGLTPAAVSSQLRTIATVVGLDLVDQHGRRLHLTDAGRLLAEHAGRIEIQLRELEQDLENRRSGEQGLVTVGASTTAGTYLLPPLLAAFAPRYPGITVSLKIGNSAEVERWLLDGDADLAFSGFPRVAPDFETQAVVDDTLVFACAPGHPLANGGPVTLERLLKERCLVRERGSATRRVFEERLYERSLELEHPLELPALEAIKQGVMAGLGISWFSSFSVERELAAGLLVAIDVPGLTLSRTFSLVRLRRRPVPPSLRTFLAFAKTWAFAGGGRPG